MTESLLKYRLRVSAKSLNVRLRVTPREGLEVVVPRGYDHRRIGDLLRCKKHWIKAALERAEEQRKFFERSPVWRWPSQIKLQAIGSLYYLHIAEADLPFVSIRDEGDDRLIARGRVHSELLARAALARWLMRQTRKHLVPRLEAVRQETGLQYERVFVKRQRTRWASCSRRKTISLNTRLLFLPPALVSYALVHELCHIAEMNHSRLFWSLLGQHCPKFRELDARLRDMWKVVPRWARGAPKAASSSIGTSEPGRDVGQR
jgi:predicted metal-dependent hydrolase